LLMCTRRSTIHNVSRVRSGMPNWHNAFPAAQKVNVKPQSGSLTQGEEQCEPTNAVRQPASCLTHRGSNSNRCQTATKRHPGALGFAAGLVGSSADRLVRLNYRHDSAALSRTAMIFSCCYRLAPLVSRTTCCDPAGTLTRRGGHKQ
jgi:hypothetical protein